MEVKKIKENFNNTIQSNNEYTSEYADSSEDESIKQDALIIEYCPRIFKELRALDDISNSEIEKYLYLLYLVLLILSLINLILKELKKVLVKVVASFSFLMIRNFLLRL